MSLSGVVSLKGFWKRRSLALLARKVSEDLTGWDTACCQVRCFSWAQQLSVDFPYAGSTPVFSVLCSLEHHGNWVARTWQRQLGSLGAPCGEENGAETQSFLTCRFYFSLQSAFPSVFPVYFSGSVSDGDSVPGPASAHFSLFCLTLPTLLSQSASLFWLHPCHLGAPPTQVQHTVLLTA